MFSSPTLSTLDTAAFFFLHNRLRSHRELTVLGGLRCVERHKRLSPCVCHFFQVVFSRHCSPCDIKELLCSSSNIPRSVTFQLQPSPSLVSLTILSQSHISRKYATHNTFVSSSLQTYRLSILTELHE